MFHVSKLKKTSQVSNGIDLLGVPFQLLNIVLFVVNFCMKEMFSNISSEFFSFLRYSFFDVHFPMSALGITSLQLCYITSFHHKIVLFQTQLSWIFYAVHLIPSRII